MFQKHDENLKPRLKDYNVNPFEDSWTVCLSNGQESDFSVVQRLLETWQKVRACIKLQY